MIIQKSERKWKSQRKRKKKLKETHILQTLQTKLKMFTTEESVTVLCGLCSILMGYLTFGSSGILFVVAIMCIVNTMFDFETMNFVTEKDKKRRRQVELEADAAYAREVHRKEVRRQQKARDARFERQRMADVRLLQQQAVERQQRQQRQKRQQRQQERKRQREALQRDAQRREAHRRRMVEEEANRHGDGKQGNVFYRYNLARANGLPSNYFDDY